MLRNSSDGNKQTKKLGNAGLIKLSRQGILFSISKHKYVTQAALREKKKKSARAGRLSISVDKWFFAFTWTCYWMSRAMYVWIRIRRAWMGQAYPFHGSLLRSFIWHPWGWSAPGRRSYFTSNAGSCSWLVFCFLPYWSSKAFFWLDRFDCYRVVQISINLAAMFCWQSP